MSIAEKLTHELDQVSKHCTFQLCSWNAIESIEKHLITIEYHLITIEYHLDKSKKLMNLIISGIESPSLKQLTKR